MHFRRGFAQCKRRWCGASKGAEEEGTLDKVSHDDASADADVDVDGGGDVGPAFFN